MKDNNRRNWSRFNFIIKSKNKGKYLLYNSYTNGLLEIDASVARALERIRSSDDCSALSREELIFLQENYLLVESDEAIVEQLHHQSLQRVFDKTHLILTIAPTQNCNFNCEYCYEKWRTPGSMSDQTERAIISYIEKRIREDGLDTLNLTWYGGEPLLESKRIESLGEKIKMLEINVLENEIITNGFLLDEKRFDILNRISVDTIQVTIDGSKEIHDLRRPLLNGGGTFDRIIHNLDRHFVGGLKERFTIAIRVNIDKSNQELFWDIYTWLHDRYQSDKLVVYPGWVYLDESNQSKCKCFSRNEATDFCISAVKEKGICLEKIFPDDITIECLVRNPNNLIIGWQGELYKCYEDLGDASLVVGNINDIDIINNEKLIAQYSVGIDHFQDQICKTCPYLPICHGGCPKRRFENKYEGKNYDCCTPFKDRLGDFIDLQVKF